eukprot:980326_1
MEYLKDPNKQVKYLPVSWLSCFPEEDEYLFYGEHVVFKIADIYTNDKGLQGHSAELNVLNKLQKVLNGEQVKWNKDQTDIQMLLSFITHRLNRDTDIHEAVSDYGIALFDHFCDNTNKICIYDFKLLPKPLNHALFVDNDNKPKLICVSFSKITRLFTNLTHISLIALDLHSMTTDASDYASVILNYIESSSQNTRIKLRKIMLQSKKQTDTKPNSNLQKAALILCGLYRAHGWDIYYELTHDLRNVLSFTNHNKMTSEVKELEMKQSYVQTLESNDIGGMDWNTIIECVKHEMWPKLGSIMKGIKQLVVAQSTITAAINVLQRNITFLHDDACYQIIMDLLQEDDGSNLIDDYNTQRA